MTLEEASRASMTPCQECGMPCHARDYHPFAACLMFKACHDSSTVNACLDAVRAPYQELLYAVASKHRGESRHQTALRYIQQAEQGTGERAAASQPHDQAISKGGREG